MDILNVRDKKFLSDGFWLFIYSDTNTYQMRPFAMKPMRMNQYGNVKSVSIIGTSIKRENGATIRIWIE